MEQCQLKFELVPSAGLQRKGTIRKTRGVSVCACMWRNRSDSRHTVLWAVLRAWWGENGNPDSISDQLGLHNVTTKTLTLCNSKTVQVERGQREMWKQTENKNECERDWCRKERFRRMNIHDPYPPSATHRKLWLCKNGRQRWELVQHK